MFHYISLLVNQLHLNCFSQTRRYGPVNTARKEPQRSQFSCSRLEGRNLCCHKDSPNYTTQQETDPLQMHSSLAHHFKELSGLARVILWIRGVIYE